MMSYKLFVATSFVLLLMSSNIVYCGNNSSTQITPIQLSDSDSEEIFPQSLELINKDNNNNNQKLSFATENNNVSCHVLNVGEGNCVFLHGPLGTVVIDAGTNTNCKQEASINKWNEFSTRYNNIIEYCFNRNTPISFVITHLDIDHYAYIPFLVSLALNNGVQCLNFFIGCTTRNELNSFYEYLAGFDIDACTCCNIFYRITPARNNSSSLFNWYDINNNCISIYDVEHALKYTIGHDSSNFYILEPINGLVHNDNSNSQSIVVLFEHNGSNILFTGDATGDTLEAVLGNVNAEIDQSENIIFDVFWQSTALGSFFDDCSQNNIPIDKSSDYGKIIRSSICKRNRNLLKCVNLLMEPHHGSSNDGCNFWLANIIKLSGDNFVGVISSADSLGENTYGHRSHALTFTEFPLSAKGILKKDVFFKNSIQ